MDTFYDGGDNDLSSGIGIRAQISIYYFCLLAFDNSTNNGLTE